MTTRILYLFTRTPLHVGAGSSVGAIDQPIQRERHTGFPIIPGSSIKGVMRDRYLQLPSRDDLFGKGGTDEESRSGDLSFGEARLVAFPVRSAKGAFALAVSPLTLERLARDAGWNDLVIPDPPDDMECDAGDKLVIRREGHEGVVLEEYKFGYRRAFPEEWEKKLSNLLNDAVLSGASGRFVLLSDGDLAHFAVSACQVNQHVRIDSEKGTAVEGALFNEETVPSETLFYSTLTPLRKSAVENELFTEMQTEQLIQFGGDGTTGLGFCTAKLG